MSIVRPHPNSVLSDVVKHRFVPDGPAICTAMLNPLNHLRSKRCAQIEWEKKGASDTSGPTSSSGGLRRQVEFGDVLLYTRHSDGLSGNGKDASYDVGAPHPALNDLDVSKAVPNRSKASVGIRHSSVRLCSWANARGVAPATGSATPLQGKGL